MVMKVHLIIKNNIGNRTSKYLSKYLPEIIEKNITYNENGNSVKDILIFSIKECETKLKELNYECGSTVLLALLINKDCYILCIGDSRGNNYIKLAVLCDKDFNAKRLSIDHKPTNEIEKKRIEELGGNKSLFLNHYYLGIVINNRYFILFNSFNRIKNSLISRSVGSFTSKPFITSEPSIFKYKLEGDEKFIILA
jgi:serine/threonine protein phosphatase PrpC